MSEKIYAWLLRLYPAHFRETYRDAALQLFRDRSRHERGFFPTLRLWLDLLADLLISLPPQHRLAKPALLGAAAPQSPGGTPSFQILESQPPRFGALLLGGVLTLAAALGASVPVSRISSSPPPGVRETRPPAGTRRTAQVSPAGTGRLASAPEGPPGAPQTAAGRQRVLHEIAANLQEHYFDPAVARKMAEALEAREKSGAYDAITNGRDFAALLTRELRETSHDLHLDVVYSETALPNRLVEPSPEGQARYREAMERQNCTFEKVAILPGNVGYVKLNSFPDPSVCRTAATAAMVSLNHAGAIIFDLRDNRGGSPEMVMLLAAYLFDHPEYMYNPREKTTEKSWTQSPVPGNSLADKPVYLLISAKSRSAAEHFSYNLKMLKRATLVGETTEGAAHAGVFHRLDEHFGIGIPEAKALNPFSKSDWEGTGVEPDVRVKAADALATAEKLLQSRSRRE